MNRFPDFIIIGAMKCATSTLHEQLDGQSGITMSRPKEPNFFSDDKNYAKGIDWYCRLFRNVEMNSLCGESSTHYTKLPTYPNTITRMRRYLPKTVKFIYIMRDPIERLISHYIHEWTQRDIADPIEIAVNSHARLTDYSRYAMQLEPFVSEFGADRILPMFLERIRVHPKSELARLCEFIGYTKEPCWNDELSRENVSVARMRRSRVRDAVVNAPVTRFLRRTFVPKSVRTRIGNWWTIGDRPQLSEKTRHRLVESFDEDLKTLSHWFGMSLSCETFQSVAEHSIPDWKSSQKAVSAT